VLFNLEHDTGSRITGYVVPDSLTGVPTIRVVSEGKELLSFAANEKRPTIANSGRHGSGQCGFSIDAKAIPDLAKLKELEIYDADTGLLIYRRPPAGAVEKKIFRLETHLIPLWQFDDGLRPAFQYFARGIEGRGVETVRQLFLLNKIPSIHLSGRILYKTFAPYLDKGFIIFVMIQDPYDELAERLLALSAVRKLNNADLLGLRDGAGMRATIEFSENLIAQDPDDEKSFLRVLKRMPADVAATLSNPLTRQLTVAEADAFPARNAIATALDVLSSAAVFGLRSDQDMFRMAVGEFLQIDAEKLARASRSTKVPALAAALKRSGQTNSILEQDLELYHYVMQASENATLADR
jgi:hypothetical protein